MLFHHIDRDDLAAVQPEVLPVGVLDRGAPHAPANAAARQPHLSSDQVARLAGGVVDAIMSEVSDEGGDGAWRRNEIGGSTPRPLCGSAR